MYHHNIPYNASFISIKTTYTKHVNFLEQATLVSYFKDKNPKMETGLDSEPQKKIYMWESERLNSFSNNPWPFTSKNNCNVKNVSTNSNRLKG